MNHKIFPAELDSLHEMLKFIQDESSIHKIGASLMGKITLAAEEALVNIIHYGYPDARGTIEIECGNCCEGERSFSITIKDQGVPFDPIRQAPIPAKLNPTQPLPAAGGYGIYIFLGVMDQVEYQRTEEGNRLTLIKYL